MENAARASDSPGNAATPCSKDFPVPGKLQRVPGGTRIVAKQAPADCFYRIQRGSVCVSCHDEQGHVTILAYLFAGEIFGELGLAPGIDQRTADVVARDDCEILRISYRDFRAAAAARPDLWLSVVRQLSARLQGSTTRVQQLSHYTARQRILSLLLDLAASPCAVPGPGHATLTISRSELARMAGCSREMVSRELQQLHNCELIRLQGRNLIVPLSCANPADIARGKVPHKRPA